MRLLTRLLLAGVCALAAWLLAGTVTIRALDDPTRLGLLPGRSVPLVFLALFLALSATLRQPERAVLPVLLATLATLPWWPVPLPPAASLLAGPLGWAWFLACLTLAARVPSGVWWQWRAPRLFADPRRAPEIAAVVVAGLLTASALHMAPRHPDGDEPDYLIIAQSLLADRDLRIENNHQQFDYAAYHEGVLPPSYLQRGRDGHIYPVHAPGLPVLLLPGFAALGYPGAVAVIVLVAALGAALLWHLAHVLTESATAAWMAVAGACGSATFFLHGFTVFPDAPASVLCLVGIWAIVEPARVRRWSLALVAVGLVWLPWLHTRYVVLAAGLGLAIVLDRAWRGRARDLVWFVVPAATGAAAWFTFFWVIYGTPSPAAPYGAYTQVAWRHIPPGLLGLLVDQQFGLVASAPVMLLALASLRWLPRVTGVLGATGRPRAVAAVLVIAAVAYVLLTASYRMWWGGLSAPARFLAPLVLPAGLALALGWQALRTRASRHLAVALLVVTLALTALMVTVDRGRLAYDERDGRARWTVWVSPLVDLSAALPASHRDAPGRVARDASVWLAGLLLVWLVLRAYERHGRLRPEVTLAAVGLCGAACVTAVWWVRTAEPWQPLPSQVRWLEHDARQARARRVAILPAPAGQRRPRFDLDLLSQRRAVPDDYTLLTVQDLPPGRYRVLSTSTAPGARFGVVAGQDRTAGFIAEMEADEGLASTRIVLPTRVDHLMVRGSREASLAGGRTWLRAEDVRLDEVRVSASARSYADLVLFFARAGAYPERDGFWTAGDARTSVGITGTPGRRVWLRASAGASRVVIDMRVGQTVARHRLEPGESALLDVGRLPRHGAQVVDLETEGGFRPALTSPGSDDGRLLGVWVALDQNRTTPIR
jgi:hypothetical protein